MKSSKRDAWLKHSKPSYDNLKPGKKMFQVRKNTKSFELSALQDSMKSNNKLKVLSFPNIHCNSKSVEPNYRKDKEIQVESSLFKDLKQQIKRKNSEIQILRFLFENNQKRLKDSNFHSDSKTKIFKDMHSNPTNSSIDRFKRNSSVSSIRNKDYIDYIHQLPFKQKKYTKNSPKIILTNPITGILPTYLI
jgi:ATP-dependent Lon protease